MSGFLYVTGTPIGNLGDITLRALEILQNVDFIAAEDTRVTLKLLNKYEIKKPMISYHEHNASKCAPIIIERIQNGENCAIVTDAGMPCISDPGETLVKLCHENGIPVKATPGPSAVITALSISGMNTSRFAFEGFLSVKKNQRYQHLESIAEDSRTLIFYEAPHKLKSTLKDMLKYLGDRKISICRELTKIYEDVMITSLSEAYEFYRERTPKGEFVLIIEGIKKKKIIETSIDDAVNQVQTLIDQGVRSIDACKDIAKKTGFKKSELYSKIQKAKLT